jgi:hypothetical protein
MLLQYRKLACLQMSELALLPVLLLFYDACHCAHPPTRMMEIEMAPTETHVGRHSWRVHLLGLVLNTAATAIAALRTWQRTVLRRRAIADLSPDQLRDIGHAEAPAPVLEVKAGLITNLMSIR